MFPGNYPNDKGKVIGDLEETEKLYYYYAEYIAELNGTLGIFRKNGRR